MFGTLDYAAFLRFQEQVHREVEQGEAPGLILCEIAPFVSVGREGSWTHIHFDPDDDWGKEVQVRWVARGGGCWLHLPGQLLIAALLPLVRMRLTLGEHLLRLQTVLRRLLAEYEVAQVAVEPYRFVLAGKRPIACLGVAVNNDVTGHGAVLNVNPLLEPYRRVFPGERQRPMTSIARECRRPLRPARVRERLLEHFQAAYGFSRCSLFLEHPSLSPENCSHAIASPG
jgi:lipoate-protein ligase B